MDIQQPIPTQSIQHISQLARGHPVFQVDLADDSIVIKSEDTRANKNLRDPIEIMNVIDPNAQTRVITRVELMALRNWVQGNGDSIVEEQPGNLLIRLVGALKPPTPGPTGQVQQQDNVWILMELKQELRDLDGAGQKRLANDKSRVKEVAKALNQPGTLEKLGEIVAADAFNGNQDRLRFDGSGQRWPTPDDDRLECIANPGNFFFGRAAGKTTILGLDSFDPANDFNDIDTFPNGVFYPGTKILKQGSNGDRKEMAQKLVADLETILGPRNRKLPFARKQRLPKDAALRIERGMHSGAQKIQNHLKQKYRGRTVSAGLKKRLTELGWSV